MTPAEREWLEVRAHLGKHRYEMGVRAAEQYPGQRVAGTPLLAGPGWLPDEPVPMRDIGLMLDATERPVPEALIDATASVRPAGYPTYSDAMRELCPPAVFQNRRTYRLTGADLARPAPVNATMSFELGRYFDGVDVGEAAAHEFAAGLTGGVRAAVGDPCDLGRRPVNLAVSTLTIEVGRKAQPPAFSLHWRDPRAVGHAGGLYHVIPVGIFQPSGETAGDVRNDFSLWRCVVREFAEELCGHSEEYSGLVDYDEWPLAQELEPARAWCVGLGTDPLTYATDLLAVLVIDGSLRRERPGRNAEGRVLSGLPFDAATVERFAARERTQAAGAALLRLAWSHRDVLLA